MDQAEEKRGHTTEKERERVRQVENRFEMCVIEYGTLKLLTPLP
jgi:hypothetical protein